MLIFAFCWMVMAAWSISYAVTFDKMLTNKWWDVRLIITVALVLFIATGYISYLIWLFLDNLTN